MRRSRKVLLARSLPAAWVALAAGPAIAAPSAKTPAETAAGTPAKIGAAPKSEEVVVTATRRPQRLVDVPVAVSVINNATLRTIEASGDDVRVLAARVPSLNIESSLGRTFPRTYIRGLGNSDFHYNASQPVSYVYDDVPYENPILRGFPLFDTQDVEVLRGPQGTLFGRNTPAGVIKIDSAKPTDTFGGSDTIDYANYDTVNETFVVNAPVVPGQLDTRLSVLEQRRGDWVSNESDPRFNKGLEGYSDTAARLQFATHRADGLSINLSLNGRHLDGTARLFRANIIEPGTNRLVPGFDIEHVAINGDNIQRLNNGGFTLDVADRIGLVTVTSVTGYQHADTFSRGDVDGGDFQRRASGPGFDVETADQIPGLDQFSQEVRVSTNLRGPWFNQGGAFYFHELLPINSLTYDTATSKPASVVEQSQLLNSIGVFDELSWKPTRRLRLSGGVRYSADWKAYHFTTYDLPSFGSEAAGAEDASASNVSWDIAATYAVTPHVNVYGRIATGYQAPALQEVAATNAISTAGAQRTTSYETGLKGTAFGQRAIFGLDGYIWHTSGLQLTAVGGSDNSVRLLNAKAAIGEGVEADADFHVTPELTLSGNASYNYTEIQDSGLEVAGCGACTMLNVRDPRTGNYRIDGNPLPQAPRWIVNGTVRYALPVGERREIYVLTDWSFRSQVDFFLYKSVEFTGQTLLLGGLRAGYLDRRRNFEVAGFVRNITNRIVATGAIDFDNLEGFVNDPRIYGVEARVGF